MEPPIQPHRAGFVSIIGKPNVGKSTLMNALMGERLSIVTSKAQTTRHRILGILNGDDFQLIYSDTPGIIQPKYELHSAMMSFVYSSLEDADVILFVTDIYEKYDEEPVVTRLRKTEGTPIFVLVNKIDQADQAEVEAKVDYWHEHLPNAARVLPISALEKFGTGELLDLILAELPEHPAYHPKDELTDKPERFFAAEMIREKIFKLYKKEVPLLLRSGRGRVQGGRDHHPHPGHNFRGAQQPEGHYHRQGRRGSEESRHLGAGGNGEVFPEKSVPRSPRQSQRKLAHRPESAKPLWLPVISLIIFH